MPLRRRRDKGGLALDVFQTEKDVHHGYKIWEQIRKLVAAGEMPPEAGRNVPMVKSGTCWQIGRAIRWIPLPNSSAGWSGDGSAAEPE